MVAFSVAYWWFSVKKNCDYNDKTLFYNEPGIYYLDKCVYQDNPYANGIVITAENVTLIIRTNIIGVGGEKSNNCGIMIDQKADNCKIINQGGEITGFTYGIRGDGAKNTYIEGVNVKKCFFRGIRVYGDGADINNCKIDNITGAMWTPNAYCMGIEVCGGTENGGLARVINNTVTNVHGMAGKDNTGESVGICISDKEYGATVKGNTVKNDYKPDLPPGGGASIGLWVGGSSNVEVNENEFDTWDYAVACASMATMTGGNNVYYNCSNAEMHGGIVMPTIKSY